MQQFDLIIIGSGPAGYTGAIRAAQLGMRVACIEYRETLGGTCLNVGCIPSKALLNFSEKYEEASKSFANIGIQTEVKLNLLTMISKKDQIVSDLCKGISGLFTKNKITRFFGKGSFISPSIIEIASDKGKEQISAKNILIATGSKIIELPNVEIDEKQIVSSSGILDLQKVPQHLVVVGGGYIGIELGSVWRRLGAKVTIVEYGDKLVPMLDEEIGSQFTKIIVKQGIELKLSTKVLKAEKKAEKVSLQIQKLSDNKLEEIVADVVLVSIGRKPNSENLGLDKVGIVTDKTGKIEVNDKFQTRLTNIYAVGDVIKGPMLAHKAEEEAIAAVEIMAGGAGHVNYNLIPSVIYTHPEVASIGKTEQQLKEDGIEYKVGKFPFLANSRARTMLETDGMVKLLADKKTDELLGAHIIGPQAGSQIAELTAYMEFRASAEDVARTCHAHPTLNEAIKEAALAVDKRAINF